MKRTNRRIRVPDSMYPCSDKERMFIENVGVEEVERFVTTVISRDGAVTKFPGKCPHFSYEGEVVQSKPRDFYARLDHAKLEERNRNGRLGKDEGELGWNGVDSDLDSAASSKFNRSEWEGKCESGV